MSKLSSQCNRTALLLNCQLLCGGLVKAAAQWCRSHKPASSNTNDLLYGYQASGTTGENRRRSCWALFTRRSSPLPFNSISACWHAAYHMTTLNSVVNHWQQFVSEIFTFTTIISNVGMFGDDRLKSLTHTLSWLFYCFIKYRLCAVDGSYLVLDSNYECLPSMDFRVLLTDGWIQPNNYLEEFNHYTRLILSRFHHHHRRRRQCHRHKTTILLFCFLCPSHCIS